MINLIKDKLKSILKLFKKDEPNYKWVGGTIGMISVQPLQMPKGKIFYNHSTNYIGVYGKASNITIQSNGRVGIGCINPTAKLHINGGNIPNLDILIKTKSNVKSQIREQRLGYILGESK